MSLLCPSLAVSLSLTSSFRSLGHFSIDEPMALTSEGPEWGKRGVQICDRGLAQQSPKTGGGGGRNCPPRRTCRTGRRGTDQEPGQGCGEGEGGVTVRMESGAVTEQTAHPVGWMWAHLWLRGVAAASDPRVLSRGATSLPTTTVPA